MPATSEEKKAAMHIVMQGLREGTIKVKVVLKCQLCGHTFDTDAAFDAHLYEGKTTDPQTGQKRKLCSNWREKDHFHPGK